MGSYGIKVAQENYDILNDPDYKQIFNSSWPTLNVVSAGTATTSGSGGVAMIATHSLGYVPMYFAYETTTANKQYIPFDTAINDTLLQVGNDSVRTFKYFIFDVSLELDFEAASVDSQTVADTAAARDKNFGIKVSKPGKDVSSTDIRDFAVHSGTRSPMVHRVKRETTTGGVNIAHNLGYAPYAWLYGEDPFGTFGAGYYSVGLVNAPGATFGLTIDSTNINVNTALTDWVAVILKDPVLIN